MPPPQKKRQIKLKKKNKVKNIQIKKSGSEEYDD